MRDFILYLLGLICFLIVVLQGLLGEPGPRRVNFVALGLAFWIFVPLLHAGAAL